jgi:hypothetical protein
METRESFIKSQGNFIPGTLFLLFVFMGGTTSAQSAQSTLPAGKDAGTFQVQIIDGTLSLEANQVPLIQVFQEIGKQAKITFDSNIGPEETITIHLYRVPLEEGIKQLAKNVTVFYTENPRDKSRRITRVVVLSERKEPGPGQPKTSLQPEKVKEPVPQATTINKPAPQPEPFKFEFDPAKSAEKEKARKQP